MDAARALDGLPVGEERADPGRFLAGAGGVPLGGAAFKPSRRFGKGAAEAGILGIGVPEQYGGLAGSDYRHSAVVTEEIQALGLAIEGLRVQTDICLPHLLHHGSAEQRATWLPRMTAGAASTPPCSGTWRVSSADLMPRWPSCIAPNCRGAWAQGLGL
jgi:alkylation response protein AidB-like acyl-CoA dehydrogenase